MTHELKDPACSDQRFMNIHIYKVYYVNWNFEKQHLISGRYVLCEKVLNDFGYMETRKMETCCGGPGSDNISQCSPFSDNRRSLRSVTKFHQFDFHNLPSNLAVWKGLQPNNQVHYNGGSNMHCYGTRFGGKSATEITVRRNTWEDQRNVRIDHQRGRATSCCEDDILSTVGDLGHQLRSRSHKWMPSSFLVTNAENDSHLRFGHISQGSNSEPQPARTSRDSDIHFNIDGDKKLNLITARKKRLTAEEKLIEDNKAYYKLEMKNNKLRSSYYFSGSRHITDMGQTFSKETVSPLPTLLKDPGQISSAGSKASDHKAFGNRKFSEDGTSDGCKLRSSRKVEEQNINDHNLDKDDPGDKKCDQGKDNTEVQKCFQELKYNRRTIDDSDLKTDQKVNSYRKVCDHKNQLKKFNCEKSSPSKECSEYRKSLKDRLESKANLDSKVKHNSLASGPHRIRLSELSRLSNEAENFMFGEPVRKESFDDSSEDEVFLKGKILKKDDTFDEKEKVKRNPNSRDCLNKKSEEKDFDSSNCSSCVKVEDSSCDASNTIHCDESSMGSVDTCSIGSNSENSRRRRKRRTQAEAFIHDNLDYYKFEIPGSRLRFQGSILPHTPALMNHAPSGCGIIQDNTLNDRNSDFNKENNCISSQLDVSAKIDSKLPETRENAVSPQENLPNETDTAHSKVDPKIKDEDCSGSAVRNNVSVLQFSFEAVPHNEPWYQTYQRQDEGEEIYLSSAGDATYWKPFLLPYEMPPSEVFGGSLNSPVYNRAGTVMRRKKRTNRFAHLVDDKNPRKSPRCHASTLAILSDLMHYRKRKDPDKSKEEESLNSVSEDDDPNRDDSSSVSTTKQSSVAESVGESSTDLKELAKRIDEMLSYPSNDNITTRLLDSSKLSSEVCNEKAKTKPIRSGVRKSVKGHRQKTVNNVEQYSWKEPDSGVDFDPFVAEQLACDAANYKYCLPKPSIRSRGGPLIDVVTLLDGFSDCTCTEDVGFNGKECVNCGSEVVPSSNLNEASCNGSEYEASSTCETVVYSDAPESKLTLPGRKRKRKKNRTGWPVGKKRIYKKVGKTDSLTNKSMAVSILTKQKSNGVGALSSSGIINRDSAVEVCSKATDSERVKETDLSNIVNKLDESVLCKSCETLEKLSSKDELENTSHPADSVSIEKQLQKSPDIVSSPVVTDQQKIEKHNRLLRTGSLDSSTHCSQLQPCVRVKKISNISDYIYVPSGASNNRRLRSASSSSLSIPTIKKDLSDESVKELNRRSSRKKTPTKFTDNWESWLPPSRR